MVLSCILGRVAGGGIIISIIDNFVTGKRARFGRLRKEREVRYMSWVAHRWERSHVRELMAV